ncbi:hypothetical protein CALVIDRAFT_170827 [Calocera viscosa TUFC12733]|uniref:Uncharacterized protein n=1 Tax=Calocera viscosa (strain TUFC12733) TaxID=1330018 RepID=A0A167L7K6_CALVF|nr:hypothetical protein CALVIDRAFT_170827 [Calocera viscosa TUFC12733]
MGSPSPTREVPLGINPSIRLPRCLRGCRRLFHTLPCPPCLTLHGHIHTVRTCSQITTTSSTTKRRMTCRTGRRCRLVLLSCRPAIRQGTIACQGAIILIIPALSPSLQPA